MFGYEVYAGEALLTLAAIGAVTFLCIRSKMAVAKVMIVMSVMLSAGITICFIAAAVGHGAETYSFEPLFIPGKSGLSQIMRISFISPWAFIGFENVTHSSEEYRFKPSRLFRILVISVITSTLLYIFVTLLSVTAYPPECTSWFDYISHLDRYEGIEGLPPFYAAHHYLGNTGVYVLMAVLLALVLTSLIGNMRALSRLFYAIARDDILPRRFAELNSKQLPQNAILLIALISLPIPFLGRTAIGWIVDVTTIGAALIYGFAAAATYKIARKKDSRPEMITGAVCFTIMILFGVFLLFPNLFSNDTLETETYILLIVWSIIGFFYFRRIIMKDHARRFGKAIIVWISLLALIVFMALIWSGRRDEAIMVDTVRSIQSYYESGSGAAFGPESEAFIEQQIHSLHQSNVFNTMVVIGMFILALGAMVINHLSLQKWQSQTAKERDSAREVAYKDPLTGVKSKHAFVEAEKTVAERIYHNDAEPFSVVVCDVNGLKQINDTLGHKAGDMYIRAASEMISEYFKHSPVYRIGGDEFAVILEKEDYQRRREILESINRQIEKNIGTGNVVASLGMADYAPATDNTFHAVFTRADALMYERKKQLKAMGAVTRD
ncbi:MAG: amino acid permease [Clostridia bacterium]|nr:amino acid permease [Clostridia bacterium]